MEIESLEHNPVPEWVAGMVGVLSGLLVLLVIFLTTNTAEPTKEEGANQRSFRAGLLQSLFGGRLALAVVASFVLWLLLTLAIMVPFFWFSPEAPPKPGLNLTASINFCEGPDFVHSELLAEPVNVVTSFLFYWPVGLVGLLGPKEGRRELRFALSYGSIGLIGFGSGALHASLDAVAQAGDELPMLYAATMLCFCCVDTFLTKEGMQQTSSWLPWLTAAVTLGNTVMYIASRDDFGMFAITFALYASVSVAYFSCYCLRVVSATSSDMEGPVRYQVVRPLSLCLGASLGLAGICWALEMGACSAVVGRQLLGATWAPFFWRYVLHSCWHAGTAMAGVLMIQNLLVVRAMQMGWGHPQLDWFGLPFVRFDGKAE